MDVILKQSCTDAVQVLKKNCSRPWQVIKRQILKTDLAPVLAGLYTKLWLMYTVRTELIIQYSS